MDYRRLGDTDLVVSALGFGAGRLGATLRRGSSEDIVRLLQRAHANGITFYDTADSYGQGKSEELIGRAFKRTRESVVIATKAGYRWSAAVGLASRVKPLLRPAFRALPFLSRRVGQLRSSQIRQDFSEDYLRGAVEGSLRRLGTETIDLYQLHSPPTEVLRRGEFLPVFDALRAEGKIRWYGVACLTIEDALICLGHPSVSSVQVTINLVDQDALTALLPGARERNMAVIARQPLAAGLLTDSPPETSRDHSARPSETSLGEATIAQAAIQFVLAQDGISTVLTGMSTVEHLEENLRAVTAPRLPEEVFAKVQAYAQRRAR